MPVDVMLVVLLSALLHASWNALVRAAADKLLDTALVVAAAGVVSLALLPFVALPAPASWPYIAASALVHVLYFAMLAFAYHGAQMSLAYPLMRGSAPALSAVAAALLLNESPSALGWSGLALISSGVLMLIANTPRRDSQQASAIVAALANAFVVAAYTLIDGTGARLSGSPASYTGWMFLLTGAGLLLVATLRGGALRTQDGLRLRWRRALLGGVFTFGSYALTLWAMTRAPIALVAALREISVVFGMLIAAAVLGERITRARGVSMLLVLIGAAAIRMA